MTHRLTLLALTAALCSCGSLQPDGPWKDVMNGEIFSGSKPMTEEEKKSEEAKRESAHQVPVKDDEGGLNLKMRF
jgi:hypothetical protein